MPAYSTLSILFGFSFLVALTGAMAPGPLLTYTIARSSAPPRGYLTGLWVIAGHALIEALIILGLMFGLSFFLKAPAVVRGIGVIGGLLLIAFGAGILYDVRKARVPDPAAAAAASGRRGALRNPVIGGALVSIANPYWWVWWATIGFAVMVQFEVTVAHWPRLVAFFFGHEAGDLIWYLTVSILTFFGLRRLDPRWYAGILVLCGVFMIGFGLYLGIAPFLAHPA